MSLLCWLVAVCGFAFLKSAEASCLWKTFTNTKIRNGKLLFAGRTVGTCKAACAADAFCQSIDYKIEGQECWFLNMQIVKIPANGFNHYDYICTGKETIWKTDIPEMGCSWVTFSRKQSYSGTKAFEGRSSKVCMAACAADEFCVAIDYRNSSKECRFLAHEGNIYRADDYDHHQYVCKDKLTIPKIQTPKTGCYWSSLPNTNIIGGYKIFSGLPVEVCQGACAADTFCQSIDFRPGDQGCYFHNTKVRKVTANDSDHYDYICHASLQISGFKSSKTGCFWKAFDNAKVPLGGNVVFSGRTLEVCQAACEADDTCISVDYKVNTSACYFSSTHDIKHGSDTTDHYDYICEGKQLNQETPLGCSWKAYPRQKIYAFGEKVFTGRSVEVCKAVCQAEPSCKSIDYGFGVSGCWIFEFQQGLASSDEYDHYEIVCEN